MNFSRIVLNLQLFNLSYFPSGYFFNSEIADTRTPLVSRRAPQRARAAARRCCVAATRHADSVV
jgi:hypothetical protein